MSWLQTAKRNVMYFFSLLVPLCGAHPATSILRLFLVGSRLGQVRRSRFRSAPLNWCAGVCDAPQSVKLAWMRCIRSATYSQLRRSGKSSHYTARISWKAVNAVTRRGGQCLFFCNHSLLLYRGSSTLAQLDSASPRLPSDHRDSARAARASSKSGYRRTIDLHRY